MKVKENFEQIFAEYFKPELMIGREQYHCTICNAKVDATKNSRLSSAPTIFALGINRFEWNYLTMTRKKIHKQVSIPLLLDTVKHGISNAYYLLLAVVFHSGSEIAGHYFSVLRSIDDAMNAYKKNKYHEGPWINCNDTTKDVIEYKKLNVWLNSASDPSPYQCIYYKVDSIVPPSTIIIPSMPDVPMICNNDS